MDFIVIKYPQTLEEFVFNYYNSTFGITEQLLYLNPHLANLPILLPKGTRLKLPTQPQNSNKRLNLW